MLPQQALDPRVRYHLRCDDGNGTQWHGMVMLQEMRMIQESDQVPDCDAPWPHNARMVPRNPDWEIVLRGTGPLMLTATADLDSLPEVSIIPETRGGETAT